MHRRPFVRHFLLAPAPPFWRQLGWVVITLATATAMRAALSPLLGAKLVYPTYYPAALLITLVCGWRAGAAAVLCSAVLGNWLFVPPVGELALSASDVSGTLLFSFAAGLIVWLANSLRESAHELDNAKKRIELLNSELQHRAKNTLSIVQSLAHQTAKFVDGGEEFCVVFDERLSALSSAHNVLSTGEWQKCEISDLIEEALRPFAREQVSLSGPSCDIPAQTCVPLVLVLHELATNATKYGALSAPSGRVDIVWTWNAVSGDLGLAWSESGGPAVAEPSRLGFGSRLFSGLQGFIELKLDFHPAGIRCTIAVPLKAL